jgi:L-seryl-tRNA(Ser) seleniumtransferase
MSGEWRVPAMHRILEHPDVAKYEPELGRESIKRAVEKILDRARASEPPSYDAVVAEVSAKLEELCRHGLQPVINATGIIVHTNLGRAPLAAAAIDAVAQIARGYSNLEYDLDSGERGSRYDRVRTILNAVTGAEDSLIVNNCAAAVLLVLDTLAKGREVIVGRNQLIEIGGGFRIPEILERSGARLVEVGTTNRVYIKDYERALTPQTALLLRTHSSNYRIEGFTQDADAKELAELGWRTGVPVVEDLGSGALVDLSAYCLERERTVQDALADGIGLVTFSGDKLLGGPQAGVIVGRSNLIARLRGNPLLRALRVDKMTLAALGATLQLYRADSVERIPVYRMLATTLEELRRRCAAYVNAIPGAVAVESDAYVGGGALPQTRVPSIAIAVPTQNADALAVKLRTESPPIVGRIDEGRVMLDLRTIAPDDDRIVIAALQVGADAH